MLSFLKRKDATPPAGAVDEAASVQAARTRARRRLIGAAVLVGIGIAGFPLLFETQPRPIAVDIPIEIPSRESVAPLSLPAPRPVATPRAPASAAEARRTEAPTEAAPTATPTAAPAAAKETPPTTSPSAAPTVAPASAAAAGIAAAVPRHAASSVQASAVPAPSGASGRAAAPVDVDRDAQRAQALLDGKPDPAATASTAPAVPASAAREPRFVVQAGAYTDVTALRDARQKVEKLGLKTYTQVIETESGARTRVRVGPFATRDEAEKAAARIKGSGLAANILSL